jgi:hypothetical protein
MGLRDWVRDGRFEAHAAQDGRGCLRWR